MVDSKQGWIRCASLRDACRHSKNAQSKTEKLTRREQHSTRPSFQLNSTRLDSTRLNCAQKSLVCRFGTSAWPTNVSECSSSLSSTAELLSTPRLIRIRLRLRLRPPSSWGSVTMADDPERDLPPEAEAARYKPIRRLDENVVNRIAAGEIIHRPANALKELIENSLDAGATLIRITLKEGGIKMLQIQDNGCGVQPSDLPLLCERFATSKLRDFADLDSMATFGFRGEALASISYVSASMNVVTKTRDNECAYRAYYANGALAPPKPGQSSEPRQCAGTDGTLITAEDLFYNVPQRRRALRSPADEYNRALDVVSKYAVHYGGRGVGFVCRKAATNATDLNTPSSPTNTTLDTIRILHGNAVARELVELTDVHDTALGFPVQRLDQRRPTGAASAPRLLCFINNRLVDCPLLKRSIEALYATLPPQRRPSVDLPLALHQPGQRRRPTCTPPRRRCISSTKTRSSSTSVALLRTSSRVPTRAGRLPFRRLCCLSLLPDVAARSASAPAPAPASAPAQTDEGDAHPTIDAAREATHNRDGEITTTTSTASAARRTTGDAHQGLDSDLPTEASDEQANAAASNADRSSHSAPAIKRARQRLGVRIADSDCSLTSVRQLRAHIGKAQHRNLTEVVQNHTFVGVVDLHKGISLIQHETRLLLVNHDAMIRRVCLPARAAPVWQLRHHQAGPRRLPLDELVDIALDNIAGVPEDSTASTEAGARQDRRRAPRPRRDAARGACAIELERVPQLLVRLATRVDWQDEQACFDTFARQIAWSCVPCPPPPPPNADASEGREGRGRSTGTARARRARARDRTGAPQSAAPLVRQHAQVARALRAQPRHQRRRRAGGQPSGPVPACLSAAEIAGP
ncbi:hypothetical protein L1887_54928 [Cichorium endivia]|nr:hypothetical protein L1887_54928 [Cichorium endivia]